MKEIEISSLVDFINIVININKQDKNDKSNANYEEEYIENYTKTMVKCLDDLTNGEVSKNIIKKAEVYCNTPKDIEMHELFLKGNKLFDKEMDILEGKANNDGLEEMINENIAIIKELTKYHNSILIKDTKNEIIEINRVLKNIKNKTDEFDLVKLQKLLRYREFLNEFIKSLKKNDTLININKKIYYRGLSNKKHKLIPSVMRDNMLYKEDYLYHQMKINCYEDLKGCSKLEQLVKMQHYNCPTRLLDLTTNPLVALYFACKKDFEIEGSVYIFNTLPNENLYYDNDEITILSCLPLLKMNEKKELYDICISKIKKGECLKSTDENETIQKLYGEIKKEIPDFDKNIEPVDLLSCVIVEPIKNNSRILKQDGVFIINGLSLNNEELIKKIEDMIIIKINIKNKQEILEQLDILGINEATMFPEIDHISNYYKNSINQF